MKTILLAALFSSTGFLPAAELRVSVAASLAGVLNEIVAIHENNGGNPIQLNSGASNVLARQIKAGAPCDVFISADEANLNALLADKLLLETSVTKLLSNSLVIIVPADSPLKITGAKDLASPQIRRLALGDPAAVPAGVYARKWLESQNAWESVAGKIVAAENVRAALAFVAAGNVEAGIVYKTDAMTSNQVTVAFSVPPADMPPIVYPVAATRSAADPAKALAFIAFLQTEPATSIFRKHGFIPLPQTAVK